MNFEQAVKKATGDAVCQAAYRVATLKPRIPASQKLHWAINQATYREAARSIHRAIKDIVDA